MTSAPGRRCSWMAPSSVSARASFGSVFSASRPSATRVPVLSEVAKSTPKFRPRFFRPPANENVGMVSRFFVLHSIAVPGVRCEPARCKILIHETLREADDDQRLGRRIAVSALPEGIDSADGSRQFVLRPVEIDGSRFSVISSQYPEPCTSLQRQGISNCGYGLYQFWPADFFAEVSLNTA